MAPRQDAVKLLAVLGLPLAVMIGAGTLSGVRGNTRGGTNVSHVPDTRTTLRALMAETADFVPADCKLLFLSLDVSSSTTCYLSRKKPDVLTKTIGARLDKVAFTSGWIENLTAPGAFYALRSTPEQTFSVTVKPILDSRDFEGVSEVQGYASFITLAVDPAR